MELSLKDPLKMFPKKLFIDIAANLTDPMYKGIYGQAQKHEADLNNVLARAWSSGLDKIIITGTGLKESKEAVEIANTDDRLFSTVGCHPTQSGEFLDGSWRGPDKYLQALADVIQGNQRKVVAVGECGLDYDRLKFCPKETQLKYFEWQLELAKEYKLPLFLHCRNAAHDVARILKEQQDRLCGGVVHSFDGTAEEANMFISMGYFIGINGCSLKTPENLEVVKQLPVDRLMLETDAPWCEIRPSHAGHSLIQASSSAGRLQVKKEKWSPEAMVKGRNEPCNILQVLDIVAAARGDDPTLLANIVKSNTEQVFFPKLTK